MAKYEGTQEIPSELLDLYRGTLNPHPTGKIVKKRYPYRLPQMQEGRPGVHPGQAAQRERFKKAMADFRGTSAGDRARWYAAEPPWSSYLWYYNYFIMSSLIGNADISDGGAGVIKTIQVMKASCPTTGTHVFTLGTEVIGAKTVVMLAGSARKVPNVVRGSGSVATGGTNLAIGDTIDPDKCTVVLTGSSFKHVEEELYAYAWSVWPYVYALTTTHIHIKFATTAEAAAVIAFEITEHVEGAVEPVLVSISNTEVVVDWSEVPDAAAEVSIIAIEYI